MKRSRTAYVQRGDKHYLVIELDEAPNLDHVETVSGSREQFYTDWEIADTRKATASQRRLFFALLNDITIHFDVPQDFLKLLFYTQYSEYTAGKEISLSNATDSSVTDANVLLDLVIDFMFEWHVEFKKGYEMLPREEEYYLFECCRHRACTVCGREHADIHHIDTIGLTGSRLKTDHRKKHVMALCREHHNEIEQIGGPRFAARHHVPVTGVKLDLETLKKIGVHGDYT